MHHFEMCHAIHLDNSFKLQFLPSTIVADQWDFCLVAQAIKKAWGTFSFNRYESNGKHPRNDRTVENGNPLKPFYMGAAGFCLGRREFYVNNHFHKY